MSRVINFFYLIAFYILNVATAAFFSSVPSHYILKWLSFWLLKFWCNFIGLLLFERNICEHIFEYDFLYLLFELLLRPTVAVPILANSNSSTVQPLAAPKYCFSFARTGSFFSDALFSSVLIVSFNSISRIVDAVTSTSLDAFFFLVLVNCLLFQLGYCHFQHRCRYIHMYAPPYSSAHTQSNNNHNSNINTLHPVAISSIDDLEKGKKFEDLAFAYAFWNKL